MKIAAAIVSIILALPISPAQAVEQQQAPLVDCQVNQHGQTAQIICDAAGIVVLNTQVQLPTVTLPPITLPPITIRPPQVTIPGPTVTIPGPTVTIPGPTTTVPGQPRSETNRTPQATPTNSTPNLSRQPTPPSVTLGPDDDDDDGFVPDISEPAQVVGIGLLSLLIVALLILLGMWGGYYLGYKDKEKSEAQFLRSLRDQILVKK